MDTKSTSTIILCPLSLLLVSVFMDFKYNVLNSLNRGKHTSILDFLKLMILRLAGKHTEKPNIPHRLDHFEAN